MNDQLPADADVGIAEWVCPYCEQTRPSLSAIQGHITESTEGAHRGVDGLKPTQDILAYGTNGEIVERMEGVSTEPADRLEGYSKQEIIINAWLASNRNPDPNAVEAISGATPQYVSQLLNELESGEIPRETWVEVIDYGLKEELEERLATYDPEADTSKEIPMGTQPTRSAVEIIEDSSKKDRIIAAYRVDPTAEKNAVADALDVSYEYVRQIFKDIDDRAPDEMQKLQEGEPTKALEEELEDAVGQRLRDVGVPAREPEESSLGTESREWLSSDRVEGMVPASAVAGVRDKMELLREQAEYTGNAEAEFVSKKSLEWLEDLLEQAE